MLVAGIRFPSAEASAASELITCTDTASVTSVATAAAAADVLTSATTASVATASAADVLAFAAAAAFHCPPSTLPATPSLPTVEGIPTPPTLAPEPSLPAAEGIPTPPPPLTKAEQAKPVTPARAFKSRRLCMEFPI